MTHAGGFLISLLFYFRMLALTGKTTLGYDNNQVGGGAGAHQHRRE